MFAKLLTLALAASSTLAFPSKRSFSGRTTFYTTTDSDPMTACGVLYSSDDEQIVAINTAQWDISLCNSYITVEYQGKQVTAKILDECASCSFGQIDLSPGAMEPLVGSDYVTIGEVTSSWWFNGNGGGDSGSSASQDPAPSSTASASASASGSMSASTSTSASASASPTPSGTPGKVFNVQYDEAAASPSATEASASASASATDASPSDVSASPSAAAASASDAAPSSASVASDDGASASAAPSTEPSATPSASGVAVSQDPAGAASTTSQAGTTSTGGAKQCKRRVRRDRHH